MPCKGWFFLYFAGEGVDYEFIWGFRVKGTSWFGRLCRTRRLWLYRLLTGAAPRSLLFVSVEGGRRWTPLPAREWTRNAGSGVRRPPLGRRPALPRGFQRAWAPGPRDAGQARAAPLSSAGPRGGAQRTSSADDAGDGASALRDATSGAGALALFAGLSAPRPRLARAARGVAEKGGGRRRPTQSRAETRP